MYGPIYVPARLMRNHRPALRSFSVAVPARKEGDLGSPKPRGFLAEKDAFVRREAAHEGMYIRAHEAEKLEALRKKMKGQREQLEELERHVQDVSSRVPRGRN